MAIRSLSIFLLIRQLCTSLFMPGMPHGSQANIMLKTHNIPLPYYGASIRRAWPTMACLVRPV